MNSREIPEIVIQRNPELSAAILHWMADGYISRSETDHWGILVPWGCLGYALVATDKQRKKLPKTAHGKLDKLFIEDQPQWRVRSTTVIRDWTPHLWRAIGYGSAVGLLEYEGFRFSSTGSIQRPTNDFLETFFKKASTFGKMLAKTGSDEAVSAILGVDLSYDLENQ